MKASGDRGDLPSVVVLMILYGKVDVLSKGIAKSDGKIL